MDILDIFLDILLKPPQPLMGLFLHVSVILSTISGGRRNTYGWQGGGTHPTGMLSCISMYFRMEIFFSAVCVGYHKLLSLQCNEFGIL